MLEIDVSGIYNKDYRLLTYNHHFLDLPLFEDEIDASGGYMVPDLMSHGPEIVLRSQLLPAEYVHTIATTSKYHCSLMADPVPR